MITCLRANFRSQECQGHAEFLTQARNIVFGQVTVTSMPRKARRRTYEGAHNGRTCLGSHARRHELRFRLPTILLVGIEVDPNTAPGNVGLHPGMRGAAPTVPPSVLSGMYIYPLTKRAAKPQATRFHSSATAKSRQLPRQTCSVSLGLVRPFHCDGHREILPLSECYGPKQAHGPVNPEGLRKRFTQRLNHRWDNDVPGRGRGLALHPS